MRALSIAAAVFGTAVAAPLQRFVIVSQPTLKSIKYLPAYGVEEKFHKETFRKFLEMRPNFDKISVMESFFYEILVQNRILILRTEEN